MCVANFEKFADLGENHGSSRTLHVKTTNLESRTGRQPSPSTTSPTTALTPSTHLESRVRGEDPDCLSPRQSVSRFSRKFANLGEKHDNSRTPHVEATNLENYTNQQPLDTSAPFPEPLLRDLWKTAVKENPTYKFLKNAIIRGDRRFPPDSCTLVDITECVVLNNYLYFRGAFWILSFEPLRTVILYKIHDFLIAGHPGRENTFALLAKDFYWSHYL